MYDIHFKVSTRAKRIRITVTTDGTVHVSYPRRISRETAEAFVQSKRAWIDRSVIKMVRRRYIPLPKGAAGRQGYLRNKSTARTLVVALLSAYAHEFRWTRVRITNARTRWGSCSTRGVLSFNWRIVLIPQELQQYLVVHELCHLRHHNHSRAFWAEVATYIPAYKEYSRTLKRYHF